MFWNLLDDTTVQITLFIVGFVSSLWTLYLALSRKDMACRFLRDTIQRQNSGFKVTQKDIFTIQVFQDQLDTAKTKLILTVKVNLLLRPFVLYKEKKITYRGVRVRCSEHGPIESLLRDISEITNNK